MNVYEIVITVIITASLTVLAAVIIFKLQTRHRERVLLRALKSEIEDNLLRVEDYEEELSLYDSREIEGVPANPILFDEAYEALRLSGELLKLPKTVRNRLNRVISLISVHNRGMSIAGREYAWGIGLSETMGRIVEDLKVLESELGKEVQKHDERSDYGEEDLVRRYIMSNVPPFFFFGLFSIYAHYLSKVDTGEDTSILGRLQDILGPVLLPLGIAFIVLAVVLAMVSLNCRMPRNLTRVREKIKRIVMKRRIAAISYVASMTVFGLSFVTTWADLIETGIDYRYIAMIFGVGVALTICLFVDNMIDASRR